MEQMTMEQMMKRVRACALSGLLLASGACAPAMSGAAGAMPDSDIVAIAMAANRGEVVTSQPAVTQATMQPVRDFAQQMITDHTNALQQLEALGIPPTENQTSRALTESAQTSAQRLPGYNGAAFDRAYMQVQVDLHQYTLNTLDTVLIPSARNRTLRRNLEAQRAVVAAHLERARSLLASAR